jgi:hypothetical protein
MARTQRGQFGPSWTPAETRIFNRCMAALVRGRYRRLDDATEACRKELIRQRRLNPDWDWPAAPRRLSAIRSRLREKAPAAGWQSLRVHWSPAEKAVMERYVRSLLAGRFHDSWSAARACARELAGRTYPHRQKPGVVRTPYAVRTRLITLARSLGWSRAGTRWLPEEWAIVERFARAMAAPGGPTPRRAARDCFSALARLHERLRVTDPRRFRRVVTHTMETVQVHVSHRARELGRLVRAGWSPDEDRVLLRYAHALVAREYKDGPSAARACQGELIERRRDTAAESSRAVKPRSYSFYSVYGRLCRLAHGLDAPWPHTGWTAKEQRACLQWAHWYDRHRRVGRLRPSLVAAEGLQEELSQMNSQRTVSACRGRLMAERRRIHGLT